ncbi:MAG: MMPL family transporter, partial [Myxococcota bacterium]
MASIRQTAEDLNLTPERGVRVRLTGTPALNYDEMIGIAWDIGGASLFCFAMVALVLRRALRSTRVVLATLLTLLAGLIWTASFTAVSVGTLNPFSITFAILFIGLGVDFGLHLGTSYMDLRRDGEDHAGALKTASAHVGSALVFCTVTTSIGFYILVPTDHRGVAELGLIAGTGMFIILGLTLTLFPALISDGLQINPRSDLSAPVRFRTPFWLQIARYPATIRWVALGIGLSALIVVSSGVRFNANVVDMRDPETESVQAFQDLLDDSLTSPWYLNVLMPSLNDAVDLGEELEALPEVSHVVTLQSFVPDNQDEKIAILDDVAFLFEVPAFEKPAVDVPTTQDQIEALRSLHAYLETPIQLGGEAPLSRAMSRLHEHLEVFLERIGAGEDADVALANLQEVLLAPFPDHLAKLRSSLQPEEIRLENLPDPVTESMLTEDGTARIQVYPSSSLDDGPSLRRFVETVTAATPNAAGVPLNLVEFGDLVRESFFQALLSASLIIALILWLLWRSLTDMLLVMAPVSLGALLTAATARIFDIPLDFTNVVVIPLLFGIGVDSAIHLVQRDTEETGSGNNILETSTARAVFYSAFTTIVSFGSLAFAGQQGLASLGLMLTFGLFYTVLSVLVVLPALLQLRNRTRSEERR